MEHFEMSSIRRYYPLIPLLFLSLFSFPALAEVPQNNALDMIIEVYKTTAMAWEPIIHKLTLGLFWGLVIVSFTWSCIQLLLKNGGLVDVLADLTTRVITVGVSVWLLNEAPTLARAVIGSFQKIGSQLSVGEVKFSPSNVFELGLNIIGATWKAASFWTPVANLIYFITSLIILICFALIAMEMAVLIVGAFITVSGGIVMMGFLGSEWTREHAMNYFTAVLGVAVRMFVMQLIITMGYGFIHDWATGMATAKTDNMQFLALLGASIVLYGLVREIPQLAASLASGRFTMAGGGLAAAIGTAASLAAGAALAIGGVGGAAADAAKDSFKGSGGSGGPGGGSGGSGGGGQSGGMDDQMARTLDTGGPNPGRPLTSAEVDSIRDVPPGSVNSGGAGESSSSSSSSLDLGGSDGGSASFGGGSAPTLSFSASPGGGGQAGAAGGGPSSSEAGASTEKGASGASGGDSANTSSSSEKSSASESAAAASGGPSASREPSPSSQSTPSREPAAKAPGMAGRLMSAAGAGAVAGLKSTGKMALGAPKTALKSLANRTAIGRAMAEAGVKPDPNDDKKGAAGDGSKPLPRMTKTQTEAVHASLMKQYGMDRDDGNSPTNYRDTLEQDSERHDKYRKHD